MQMNDFLRTLGTEVTDVTGSSSSGREFASLGMLYKTNADQAIQVVVSKISARENMLNPTRADDFIKALLRACLKSMQAEQQVRQHQEALQAREACPVSNKQFLTYLFTLWLQAIKDDEAEQVADTLKYFWQQGYTIPYMAQTLDKDLQALPEKWKLSTELVEEMKDAQYYLATGARRRKEVLTVRSVSQIGNVSLALPDQIIEIEDAETTSITTLKLSPGANSLMLYCYPGKQTTGKPLASLQIGLYKDELEVLYWEATMSESQDPNRLVLAETIQGQKNGADE